MKRVVVTGLGVISGAGKSKDIFYDNLINGKSFIRKVDDYDLSEFNSQIAGQVPDFDPMDYGIEEHGRMDRFVHFALAAARQAIEDSHLDFLNSDRRRCGVVLANAICGTRFMEEEFLRVTDGGHGPIDPKSARRHLYDAAMFNTPSAEIGAMFGLQGLNTTVSTGCTAGSDSMGLAFEIISDGLQDVVLTGASEAPICPITIGAFDVIGALSRRNDSPEKASRPFEKSRDGFVLGEGAGILVMEELGHALRRGAHIYAEVLGYGTSCNAYHMTDLPSYGDALAASISNALRTAKINAEDISYINAHGSSTQQNDVFETSAYKIALDSHAYDIPISSIKSMIGHALAAANAIEGVLCCMVFEGGYIPPTVNHVEPGEHCDLDYVPNEARECAADIILKTSSGFSGIHSSIIFRRWK